MPNKTAKQKKAKPLPIGELTKRRTLIAKACGTSDGINHRAYIIVREFRDLVERCEFLLGEARELITNKEAEEIQEVLAYAKDSEPTLVAVAAIGMRIRGSITSRVMSTMDKTVKGKVVL